MCVSDGEAHSDLSDGDLRIKRTRSLHPVEFRLSINGVIGTDP